VKYLLKKLQGRLGLTAIFFGGLLFVFLSASMVLLFDVFWNFFKSGSPLSYLFVPVVLMQLPGYLIYGALQLYTGFQSPGMNHRIEWIFVSLLSSIFFTSVSYGLLRFERWWNRPSNSLTKKKK
jgi:hypothetical protein